MITIIGTGHVFKKSVEEVREEILKGNYDIIGVELDNERFEILKNINEDKIERNFSFKFFLNSSLLMQYVLGNIQREIGRKLNVFPGSEMREAILLAQEKNMKIFLIDRNIRITMNHLANIPLKEKIKMLFFKNFNVKFKNMDELLEKENLEMILKSFKKFPNLYKALVDERDIYMAVNLYNIQNKFQNSNILAVVGAGHKQGIMKYLNELNNGKTFNLEEILRFKKIPFHKRIENLFFAMMLLLLYFMIKIFKI